MVARLLSTDSSERSFVPPGQHSVAAVGAIVEERLPMFVRLCHTGVPEDVRQSHPLISVLGH